MLICLIINVNFSLYKHKRINRVLCRYYKTSVIMLEVVIVLQHELKTLFSPLWNLDKLP